MARALTVAGGSVGPGVPLWAIVLAGGRGTRLAPLTHSLYGKDVSKQFAVLEGTRSLLQQTIERIAPLVGYEKTLVVVSAGYEALAAEQLAPYPGVELIVQPECRGTATGVLLPLLRLEQRARPGDAVVVLPSDHHVLDPAPLLSAIERAARAALAERFPLALLGLKAEGPEPGYGWIIPGAPIAGEAPAGQVRRVAQFVEKPDAGRSFELFQSGALWSSFVMVGVIRSLLRLLAGGLPQAVSLLRVYWRYAEGLAGSGLLLERIYGRLPTVDLSTQILERAEDIAVVEVQRCGWSDWGTPQRVLQSLAGTAAGERLRALVAARPPSSAPALGEPAA